MQDGIAGRTSNKPSGGPRFIRTTQNKQQEILYPDDPELAGLELWLGRRSGADDTHFLIRPTDTRQGVFVQVRGEYPIQHGDMFVAGRHRFLFEQPGVEGGRSNS